MSFWDDTKNWVKRNPTLAGAAAGAATGTAVVPVVGTVGGAVAGAVIGHFAGKDQAPPEDVDMEDEDQT